jgi:serine/threonine protein kinase
VLYSHLTRHWKIADYGFTCEGTSKRQRTSHYGRGTSSYRAPELLRDLPVYNNKVDIWALGCIFFELCTGRKAFTNDFAVFEYNRNPQLQLPTQWVGILPQDRFKASRAVFGQLGDQISDMLSLEPDNRPPARDVQIIPRTGLGKKD